MKETIKKIGLLKAEIVSLKETLNTVEICDPFDHKNREVQREWVLKNGGICIEAYNLFSYEAEVRVYALPNEDDVKAFNVFKEMIRDEIRQLI